MNAEPPIRAAAAASAQGSDFTMPKLNRKGQPHKGTPRRRVKPKNKNVNVNVNELKPAPQPEQKSIYGSRQERKKAQNNRRKAKKYAIRRRIWRRNTATCLFSVVLLRSGPIYAPIWTPIHNPIHNVSYCNKVLSLLKLAHQPTLRQNSEHKFEVLQYKYKMEIDLTEYQRQLSHYLDIAASKFHQIPGSAIFLRYIRSSYQNDPVRSAIELVLVIFFLRYLISPSYSTQRTNFVKLTEEEIDELVDEWQPEPLTADLTEFEEEVREKLPVIVGQSGPKTKLANGKTVTNLATMNYYSLLGSEQIKEKCIQTLRTYGVGPCGPPQFYGTQDVHMKTEADIASHLGMEACIVYAHAFSTVSSVIPAFAKRGDIIVADKAVNYAIRKGLQISRSTVRWYEHNDMEDLERVLQKVVKDQAKKPLTRRFIVTEGLFETVGDVVNLPKVIELRLRYKFRIILDETHSYAVLGRTGRGVTEAQNVDPATVDMIVGTLAGPLCAGGGFCAGSIDIVEHQRISSSAYTFSAALPAMAATTTSEALSIIQTHPEILTQCRENIKAMRAQLDPRSDWITVTSSPENPQVLAVLKPEIINSRRLSIEDQERVLQECVDEALSNGVMVTRLKSMPVPPGMQAKDMGWLLQPALKICVTTGLSKKEIEKAGTVVRHAVTKVLTKGKSKTLGVPGMN